MWRVATAQRLAPVLVLCLATTAWAGNGEGERKDDSSQPKFFRLLAEDFKNVFKRKENLLIISAGLGATAAARPFDQDVASSGLNSELNGGTKLDNFFEAGEIVGGGAVQLGGAFATLGLGKLLSDPELQDLGRDLARAQIVTQSFTILIKTAVGRERPDGENRRSFPSGHTSGSFATATVLQRHYGWKVGIPAYVVAGYIAGSRLNESRHYLSDVLFGASLGIMAGRTVTFQVGKRRLNVQPAAVPGGAGVQVLVLPQ